MICRLDWFFRIFVAVVSSIWYASEEWMMPC
jgi:hypothetical protein